jgi:hypothetical protein
MSAHDLVPGHVHEELRQENVRLRAALVKVSFVSIDGEGYFCPWCRKARPQGHADDCQRQNALGTP